MATIRTEGLLESLGLQRSAHIPVDQLPFTAHDATAGSEDELQAVVVGSSEQCDLPLSIRESRFFQNIARRSASGEAPRRTLLELEAFLNDTCNVWENSWIRFPEARLSRHAQHVFQADLQVARDGAIGERSDAARFRFTQAGESWLRIPISYALKLALADLVGTQPHMPEPMRQEASRLMRHFLNDNTSPETTSFHIVAAEADRSLGEQLARDAARRFLFTSLLDLMGESALRTAGDRTARAGLSRAGAFGASGRAFVVLVRFVLSRALYEPVPFRLERRRGEISIHAPVPSGAEPQPAQCGRQAA